MNLKQLTYTNLSITTLGEHIWILKDANLSNTTQWGVLEKATQCSPTSRKCGLCLAERYWNILEKSMSLNRRTEFF